jgi:hypothetical protein
MNHQEVGWFQSIRRVHRMWTYSAFPTWTWAGLAEYWCLRFSLSSFSTQRLVDFTHLPTISQHRNASLIVFPLSQSMGSSPYVAERVLALFVLPAKKINAKNATNTCYDDINTANKYLVKG